MKRFAVLLILAASVMLTACSGVESDVEFAFTESGAFSQKVTLAGTTFSDEDANSLESIGWTYEETDAGVQLSRSFSSVEEYADPNSAMATMAMRALTREFSYSEIPDTRATLARSTKDFLFFVRHEVTFSLPPLVFEPDLCSICGGDGEELCVDCDGRGWETCDECDGTGVISGYWGDYECYYCENGRVDCDICDGTGGLWCYACDGTGDPGPDEISRYRNDLDASSLRVVIEMPGLELTRSDSGGEWKFEGDEIEEAGTLIATSYVVKWVPTGVLLVVILLGVALVVWLIVRKGKRALALSRAKREAKRAAKQNSVRVSGNVNPVLPTEMKTDPVESAHRFCTICGSGVSVGAEFCSGCGAAQRVSSADAQASNNGSEYSKQGDSVEGDL